MTNDVADHHAQHPAGKGDCGCGCNGDGDCAEAKKPVNRARRSFMVGAGTVAMVSTLANRRAFAWNNGGGTPAQCGPISHAASLTASTSNNQSKCGGLTPGFWKTHATCTARTLGFNPSTSSQAIADCDSVTLGQKLSNLATIDPVSAGMTFKAALCASSSAAFHWASAILDALSPSMNPSYGYTIGDLNSAILNAYNSGTSGSMILTALETLENDYNTNSGSCPGGLSEHLC